MTSEVSSDLDDNSSLGDVDVLSEAKPSKSSKASKVSAEEKAALAEQKKQEALAQQNQKKLLAKQEAEKKKQALAEQKAAEKLALAEQKAAEKLALAEQKKAEKKPTTLAKQKKDKKSKVEDTPADAIVDSEEADVVKKIMFEGKKYLKSKNTGIIYNMEQDVIGKWNEEKNRIDFDETGEESEEEYDN